MQALIIAAGKGNRLRRFEREKPKPLFKVAGLSLIERTILSAKKAGIFEFVIVTGYQEEKLRKKLKARERRLGVSIMFVSNPDWQKANGHSVLCAKPYIKDDFILLMSDHIFDPRILSSLLLQKPKEGELLLAVDKNISGIFDLEDATKVKEEEGTILRIGKGLTDFNAVDSGIFYCSQALFTALKKACALGNGSLSEAVAVVAEEGKAKAFDLGNRYWQDVDTPASLKEAERVLFGTLSKETDGSIARHFNRKISRWLSRFLVKMPLTPNQITGSSLIFGFLSAYLVSTGARLEVAVGGLLFQFASIYDGCDGEVAKLKMATSKFGEWLDTVCDNVVYIAFFTGVVIGLYRQNFVFVLPLALATACGVLMTLGGMYFYLLKFTDSGSLVTVQKELSQDLADHEQNLSLRIIGKIKFMMKRDFFALFFMVLCFFNRLDWILVLAAIGANLTWIVLLTVKREFSPMKITENRP
jgi:CDP-L-myo-inositol myo-inositolphosphotransferase